MAMFNRRPGETKDGLVHEFDNDKTNQRDALLYDFDIDDDTKKDNHLKYLAKTMQWMLEHVDDQPHPGNCAWKVSIDGYASHTWRGDQSLAKMHNDQLSLMREQSVAAYFREFLAMKPELEKLVKIDTDFHGFSQSPIRRGENPWFRSVRVVVHRPSFVPPPRPPVPPDPNPINPRIFRFRMRVAPVQPDQLSDFNSLFSKVLTFIKPLTKFEAAQKAIEKLLKIMPRLAALGNASDQLKVVKLAMGMLGVELIGFDIMDDQLRNGARYVYFGLAPSTDFLLDAFADKIIDLINKRGTLAVDDTFEKAIFEMIVKVFGKAALDRIKDLLDLKLKPPFPFTPFAAASLPIVRLFHFGLDDFQGAFSEQRAGGDLTVVFEDGIGAQTPVNTIPRFIKLKTGSTGISLRFGLTGVIVKGADIPFE
jgi:hypothetical protein